MRRTVVFGNEGKKPPRAPRVIYDTSGKNLWLGKVLECTLDVVRAVLLERPAAHLESPLRQVSPLACAGKLRCRALFAMQA